MTRRSPTRLADTFTSVGAFSSVANIVMQLALPPVGEGVSESRVVSGSPRRRPIKRSRTTVQYLALAVMGTDDDRTVMREAVAEVHRHVVSRAGSSVGYSGNAPTAQLWVAACLFRYFLDQYTAIHGPLDEAALDVLVRSGEPLATGVNVRPGSWPRSWAAFEQYWTATLPQLSVSPEVHRDLESLADLSFLAEAWGRWGSMLSRLLGRRYHFLTRANLPPYFRQVMGWTWTERDQRRYDRLLTVLRLHDRLLNPLLGRLVYRAYVADFRLRHRLGRPVLGRLAVSEAMIRDGAGRP